MGGLSKDPPFKTRLAWTNTTSRLDLDGSENHAIVAACALSLRDLALGTHLLEDHLGVSALVGVGMVETHCDCVFGVSLVMTVKLDSFVVWWMRWCGSKSISWSVMVLFQSTLRPWQAPVVCLTLNRVWVEQ